MIRDTPTVRTGIEAMTDEELDHLLDGIRERRLKLVQQQLELEAAARKVKRETIAGKVEHQFEMLKKEIARVDNSIEKVSVRILKIRALRLELDW